MWLLKHDKICNIKYYLELQSLHITMWTHKVQNQIFGVGLTHSTRAINKDDFSMMGNICIDYAIVGCTLPIIEVLNGHSRLCLQDLDIVVVLHFKQAIGF
jgi:hypothetical protein